MNFDITDPSRRKYYILLVNPVWNKENCHSRGRK
jgi:hypothetical protein